MSVEWTQESQEERAVSTERRAVLPQWCPKPCRVPAGLGTPLGSGQQHDNSGHHGAPFPSSRWPIPPADPCGAG